LRNWKPPAASNWFVAFAERFSSLPSWVALSEQIGSLAAGSVRRSVSTARPVFSWMQVSVAAIAMPDLTPGTFATASPISRIALTRSWVSAGKAASVPGTAYAPVLRIAGSTSPVTQRLKRFAASFVLPRIRA